MLEMNYGGGGSLIYPFKKDVGLGDTCAICYQNKISKLS